jgi:transcriptional regulator with XRE-family HTH domain
MRRSIGTSEHKRLLALLRQIRLNAGLRQIDVAKRLREPQPFVSRYESGEQRLDLLELREVCRAIGIDLKDFVREFEKVEGSRGRKAKR